MNTMEQRLENLMKLEWDGPVGCITIRRSRRIKPNTIYRHFKGKYYYVLEVCKDATNIDDDKDPKTYVVYRALYGDYKMYVRELDEFRSEVDRTKYPHAKQKYRFEELETTFEKLFGSTYKILFKDKTKCVISYTNWENVRKLVIDQDSIGYYDKHDKSLPITNDIWLLAEIIRYRELNIKPHFDALETILKHLEEGRNGKY